jgi:hypothetical protein
MFMALSGISQERYSFFFSSGYDNNMNFLSAMKYTNTNEFPDYNFGVGGAVYLNDRFRARLELKYVNMSFTRKYNFQSTTASTPDRSVLSVSNIDFNPYIDYRIFSIGKFDLYGYTGFRFEFNFGDYQKCYMLGGDTSYKNYIENNYKKAMVGLTGGCSFNYNLNKKFALSISPEFTHFLHYFYSDNSSNLERMSVNLGVEWKF